MDTSLETIVARILYRAEDIVVSEEAVDFLI